MSYQVLLADKVLDELGDLPQAAYKQVGKAFGELAREPRPASALRLVGRERWHLRGGDHLVIYAVDDEQRQVKILHIARLKAPIHTFTNGQSGS